MTLLVTYLAVATVAALGTVGVCVWLVRRDQRPLGEIDRVPAIDPESMEPLIQYAAERWATAYGRPEAAGLVADKLRTLYGVSYGRTEARRRRWWSR